ncbi:alpha/beta fold hydrolase [Chitinophaga horti]|uniref:Alpha/beta fold hydrolase n=1 Tax=Chitinophaga horti TaxID=2920382 RepID=A0ABY6J7A5_9BACT|nr:alpha/beta fold hydrolase [Chitinophaga horti]UYQ94029.1 alpha/beta fold hydrolase [Chitinophaga horti]
MRNGHIATIYPSLFRRVKSVPYSRTRLHTPDGDFLDLDFSRTGSDRIVIILHGLEGNAARPYVLGMVNSFNEGGYDTVSVNFRSCSGEPNLLLRSYHSGETGDLHMVVEYLAASGQYKSISLIGFSLGGNVTLKYVGERGKDLHPLIKGAVGISVPCDLKSGAIELERRSNYVYMQRFIRELGEKLQAKQAKFDINLDGFNTIKTFRQFDDRFTAPIHGYENAETYWAACSSRQFIPQINIPVLLVNALDDPFLGKGCYPYEEAAAHDLFVFEAPKYGGHVGFAEWGAGRYWSEQRAFRFIDDLY